MDTSAPEEPFELSDEERLAHRWRRERFRALGFDRTDADLLAAAQADWHLAERMLDQGCEPRVTVRILV